MLNMPRPRNVWCIQDFLLKYLGATAAVVLIIGPFFGNHLRPVDNVLGRAHMLSTMRYHTSVVIYLFAALGSLGSSSKKLMRLSAYADRISDMQTTVNGLASSTGGELVTSHVVACYLFITIAMCGMRLIRCCSTTVCVDRESITAYGA